MSRYYNPDDGRFLSLDKIEYMNTNNILGLDLYAYCMNDPINRWDPEGEFLVNIIIFDTIIETTLLMSLKKYKADNVIIGDDDVKIPNSALFNNPIAQMIYSKYLYENVRKSDGKKFFDGSPYDIVGEWQAHNFAALLTGLVLIGILIPCLLINNIDIYNTILNFHNSSIHVDVGNDLDKEDRKLVRIASNVFKYISSISSLGILEW